MDPLHRLGSNGHQCNRFTIHRAVPIRSIFRGPSHYTLTYFLYLTPGRSLPRLTRECRISPRCCFRSSAASNLSPLLHPLPCLHVPGTAQVSLPFNNRPGRAPNSPSFHLFPRRLSHPPPQPIFLLHLWDLGTLGSHSARWGSRACQES